MYRFVLWPAPTVEKFPRRQKFLLGDRLQGTALDVLEAWRGRLAAFLARRRLLLHPAKTHVAAMSDPVHLQARSA